jgi:hypothetical protein
MYFDKFKYLLTINVLGEVYGHRKVAVLYFTRSIRKQSVHSSETVDRKVRILL